VTFVLDYVIDSSEIKILNDVIIEEGNRGNKRSANCFGMECGFVELFEPRSTGTHEETDSFYLFITQIHGRRNVADCGNRERTHRDASVGSRRNSEIPCFLLVNVFEEH